MSFSNKNIGVGLKILVVKIVVYNQIISNAMKYLGIVRF
jgi:hypothetical protein